MFTLISTNEALFLKLVSTKKITVKYISKMFAGAVKIIIISKIIHDKLNKTWLSL